MYLHMVELMSHKARAVVQLHQIIHFSQHVSREWTRALVTLMTTVSPMLARSFMIRENSSDGMRTLRRPFFE